MKKLTLIFLLFITTYSYSQTLKLNTDNIYFAKKERVLYVDQDAYCILATEKISRNLYRMMLMKDCKYFDCVYSETKFILIEEIN
jgi:hypothetical protein